MAELSADDRRRTSRYYRAVGGVFGISSATAWGACARGIDRFCSATGRARVLFHGNRRISPSDRARLAGDDNEGAQAALAYDDVNAGAATCLRQQTSESGGHLVGWR